jgi:copper/silver efflux system protein
MALLPRSPGPVLARMKCTADGYYLEITPERPALARFGLMVGDLQETVATASKIFFEVLG